MSIASIEATLSADWQKVVSGVQAGELFLMNMLQTIAAGGQILITDIEDISQYIGAHLGILNSTVAAIGTAAAVIAPGNANVAKVLADLQTGADDVAQLTTAINTGATTGDSTVVTTALTAINAIKTTSALASQAAAALAQLTVAMPSATQAISQPTPNPG